MEAGLGPGQIVLNGDPAPSPKGDSSPPQKVGRAAQFLAHVYCGQTAGWIEMPLSREVGLRPGDIVLDGDQAPFPKRGTAPQFLGTCLVAKRLYASGYHLVRR